MEGKVLKTKFKLWLELYLAFEMIKNSLRSEAELRSAFLLQIFGMMINNTFLLFVWIFFFTAFGKINGWSANETIGLEGVTAIVYGFTFTFASGVTYLPESVNNGSFDSLLLSPRNLYLRILTNSLKVSAIGDIFFGIILLIVYFILAGSSFLQIVLLLATIPAGILIMINFALIGSLISFHIPDSSGIASNLFEIFFSPSLYPTGLYEGGLRIFFMVVIPSLLIGGIPIEAVRDYNLWMILLVWVFAIFWLFLALKLLGYSVKKYESGNLTGAR